MQGNSQSKFQTSQRNEEFGQTQGTFGNNPASLKGKLTSLEVFFMNFELFVTSLGNDQGSC